MEEILDCLKVINEIEQCESQTEVNMTGLHSISPLSALLLSAKILEAGRRAKIKIVPPLDTPTRSYLTQSGLPLEGPKQAIINHTIHHAQKDINQEAQKVLKIVDSTFPENIKGNVAGYLFGEFCDNIDQHSQFNHASIMGTFSSSKNLTEFGFFDNGITIPGNIKKRNVKFDEDYDAIELALQGVSTKMGETRGTGLYTSSNLISKGLQGDLFLISRQGAVHLSANSDRKLFKLGDNTLNGTLAYMRFKVPNTKVNIYDYIRGGGR